MLYWPSKYTLPEARRAKFLDRFNFWERLLLAGFLFVYVGMLFAMALYFQVASLGTASSRDPNSQDILITLALSGVSYYIIKNIPRFVRNVIDGGEGAIEEINPLSKQSLTKIAFFSILMYAVYAIFPLASDFIAQYPLLEVYAEVREGESFVVDLLLVAIVHLIFAGCLLLAISYTIYLRYQFAVLLTKLRIWSARIRTFIFLKLTDLNANITDQLGARCNICWKKNIEPREENEGFYCRVCGYPFSFGYTRPYEREGAEDLDLVDTDSVSPGKEKAGSD